MSTHVIHSEKECFYFITFTCYRWLPLLKLTRLETYLSDWVEQLSKRGIQNCGYVMMPNHIHLLIYVEKSCKGMNKVIGEAKRFMAYEIVKRLNEENEQAVLSALSKGVQSKEVEKGKKHQVFRLSFDAKLVEGDKAINLVLDYIHHNPVSGKWRLAEDFTKYPHSSAGFYECGKIGEVMIRDYRTVDSESSPTPNQP